MKPRNVTPAILAVVLLAAGAWTLSRIRSGDGPATPRPVGPMVQLIGPNGFAVVWALEGSGPAVLRLTSPDGDDGQSVDMNSEDGRHVARLGDLRPGRRYRYEVSAREAVTGKPVRFAGTARTPSEDCRAFRFQVLGDSGGGGGAQLRIEWCMRRHEPDLVLHVGDLVYETGARKAYPSRFFRPYEQLIASVPFYPVLGNHDVMTDNGGPMLETFLLPENGPEGIEPERCYWFDYCDARFVGVDSNLEEAALFGRVAPWLEEVLLGATTTWRFVFLHHAIYTNARHSSDDKLISCLVPALERGGADVVFAGHNHLYERTHPLRGGRVVSLDEGVVYVTTGAGGSTVYAERLPPPEFIAAYYDDDFSFTVVDVDGPRLALRQINSDNQVVDEWTSAKQPGPAGRAEGAGQAAAAPAP